MCVCVAEASSPQLRMSPLTQAGDCLLNGLDSCRIGSVLQSSFLKRWNLRERKGMYTSTRAWVQHATGRLHTVRLVNRAATTSTVKAHSKIPQLTSSPSNAIMHASAEAHRLRSSYLQQGQKQLMDKHTVKPVQTRLKQLIIKNGQQ